MSSRGGKGGSTTTSVSADPTLEAFARRTGQRSEDISRIGNIGYYGPDVAGFTPMQQMGMQNIANQASAFGLLAPTDVTAGMPQATDYGMVSGYSSGDLYDMAMRELAQRRPEQYQAISNQFITDDLGRQFSEQEAAKYMRDRFGGQYSQEEANRFRRPSPPLISPKEIYDGRVPDLSNTGSPYKRSKRGINR